MKNETKPITTTKVKKILSNKYFDVENNEVLFDNKTKGEHLLIKPKSEKSVAILALTKDFNVIIQDQYRYAYDGFITQVVKGGAKDNESFEDAVGKELEEELSLNYKELIDLGLFVEIPSIQRSLSKAFIATNCEIKKNSKEREDSEIFKNKRVIPFSSLLEDVLNNKIKCVTTQMIVLKAAFILNNNKYNN